MAKIGGTNKADSTGIRQKEIDKEPWATVFDLIQSEYEGWTDDIILDLTLDRILQVCGAINRRKAKKFKLDLKVKELVTRTICKFVAATAYPAKKGKNIKALIHAADEITFIEDEGPREPKIGSYEKIKDLFSAKRRPK